MFAAAQGSTALSFIGILMVFIYFFDRSVAKPEEVVVAAAAAAAAAAA